MPRRLSLLIVENDLSLLDLLSRNFVQQGYAVTAVGDPQQALKTAKANSFDLALLDGNLPRNDGVWLTQELKRLSADLQIVILSARTDTEFEERCIASGAFAYLRKPCGLSELEATFERVIAYRNSRCET